MGTEISGIAKGILQARTELKASLSDRGEEKGVSLSFMQMMSQNQFSSQFASNAGESSDISGIGAPAETREWAKEAYGSYAFSNKAVTVREESSPEEMLQEASGILEAYEEEIRQILKEELGVTEEEITDAMEILGISFLDLGNPQDLAALVRELTGEEVGTLFLSEPFQNIMEQVADVTEDLRAELGVTKEEWSAFSEEWKAFNEEKKAFNEEKKAFHEEREAFHEERNAYSEEWIALREAPKQMESNDAPAMEAVTDPQAVPETKDVSEMQAEPVLETELVTDDVPEEEAVTVFTEESQPVVSHPQEAENVTTQAVAVESEKNSPKQEASVAQAGLEQDETEGAEQLLSDVEPKEAETDDHSDTSSGKQSLPGHSKEPKTQDAGQGAVLGGQQPLGREEFAIPVQGQQNYSSQIDAYNLIEQIARNVRVTISSSVSSMEMQLNPEHLGKIYLSVSEREGAVRAQIAAQNEAVKEALETQVAELRQSLNQQGIKVDAIEVTVATHEFEQNLEQNARQEEQMHQQREEANRQVRRNLNLNDLDGLTGLMTEEEELAARIMRDNGNQVDLTA